MHRSEKLPNDRRIERRRWLGGISTGLIAAGMPLSISEAAPEQINPQRQRFGRMLQEWYVEKVRHKLQAMQRRRQQLKTAADAERYIKEVRAKIRLCFGPMPEKTPLNPRTTKRIQRDTYTIENVLFESRPGLFVTANLYLPKSKKPAPGVIGTCGHSFNGKMAEAYQSFAQGLARQGYVVLIFDPIGQGERIQYLDENLKPTVGGGTRDHLMAGNQQYLVGEFIGSWRAWDGIRALDYLLTRPEVDKRHIGVTGNSGGGTMTTWLCGVEDRWTMAAPSCFITSMLNNLENELPQDTEQCPPRALELGLDHLDFLAAMAPKPVIILAKEGDYFDARGSEHAARELQHLYQLLGAQDQIKLFIGPGGHGYSQENREAMYQWFNRATGVSDLKTEPTLTLEEESTLRCAPQGQVATLKSKTVFQFTREHASRLAKQRTQSRDHDQVIASVRKALAVPELPKTAPPYRIMRSHSLPGKPTRHITPYAITTEPGILAIVYGVSSARRTSRPTRTQTPAILYVADQSSDHELQHEPLVQKLTSSSEAAFYTCDVRGIGESRPNTCSGSSSYYSPYGNDYFYAAHAIMLGTTPVTQRTWDILRVVQFLKQVGHASIHLISRGWGTVPSTFAAVLAPEIQQVTLKQPLSSYDEITKTERYEWPLSSFVPGILKTLDLPECYRLLSETKDLKIS